MVLGMTATKIEVTARDIKNGIVKSTTACPIALAIRRKNPKIDKVSVRLNYVLVRRGGRVRQFLLPAQARHFVDAFDIAVPVKPFSFTLRERL